MSSVSDEEILDYVDGEADARRNDEADHRTVECCAR